jgi:hypothetical protein
MILFRALDDVRGRAAVVIGGHGIHSGLPSSGSGSMLLGSVLRDWIPEGLLLTAKGLGIRPPWPNRWLRKPHVDAPRQLARGSRWFSKRSNARLQPRISLNTRMRCH